MSRGQRIQDGLPAPRVAPRGRRARRAATPLRVERLESRGLMAASVAAVAAVDPAHLPNETLDHAEDLGPLAGDPGVLTHGALGQGPAQAADVEWYSFTLDRAARVAAELGRSPGSPSFRGVLSLYNSDPYQWTDPTNPTGSRLLDQVTAGPQDGVAALDRLLGPGTYYLAVSGAGNLHFHPLLAGSGLPGSTGDFDLRVTATGAGPGPDDGPAVLTSDPAPSAVLDRSPFVLRIATSAPLDPWTVQDGQTVVLTSSADDVFGNEDDQVIPLAGAAFATAISELQLILAAPLGPGHYQVFLAGDSSSGQPALMDANDVQPLGADADHPSGQDVRLTFQVAGAEGNTDGAADDTPAQAHDLGDVTAAGIVQVAGAIGDDPFYNIALDPSLVPANDVDLYHFRIRGPGRYAFVAEVLAGRIGSSLDPGVSLFRLDPADHTLHLVAGNNNSYNPALTSDLATRPLRTDAVLFEGLEAGEYFLAVSDGLNTPSPLEGQGPDPSWGVFDPNVSHSGQVGLSTGPYILNLLVHASPEPPHVVSTSLGDGTTLDRPPTRVVVTFDKPVNLPLLAFQAYYGASDRLAGLSIVGADGTRYAPRLVAYDSATNQATFLMLDGLANGDYELHLSGPNGLDDLAGNPLVGNDPSGDYVVRFTVDGPARGGGTGVTSWSAREPNDDVQAPQDLGAFFPHELQDGVLITRDPGADPGPAPSDTKDVYRFQVLQQQSYSFTLSGADLPAGVKLTLMDDSGQVVALRSLDGGRLLFGALKPGAYRIAVGGWGEDQAAGLAYQLQVKLITDHSDAPPLFSSPGPAVALRLDSLPPPAPPTPDPQPPAPNPDPDPSPSTPDPSSGGGPSAPPFVPPATGGGGMTGGSVPASPASSGEGGGSSDGGLSPSAPPGGGSATPGGSPPVPVDSPSAPVGPISIGAATSGLSGLAFRPLGGEAGAGSQSLSPASTPQAPLLAIVPDSPGEGAASGGPASAGPASHGADTIPVQEGQGVTQAPTSLAERVARLLLPVIVPMPEVTAEGPDAAPTASGDRDLGVEGAAVLAADDASIPEPLPRLGEQGPSPSDRGDTRGVAPAEPAAAAVAAVEPPGATEGGSPSSGPAEEGRPLGWRGGLWPGGLVIAGAILTYARLRGRRRRAAGGGEGADRLPGAGARGRGWLRGALRRLRATLSGAEPVHPGRSNGCVNAAASRPEPLSGTRGHSPQAGQRPAAEEFTQVLTAARHR